MPVLIVTTEESGVDKYSQEIAERLGAKQIATSRYLSLTEGIQLSRLICSEPDMVHLPNQNFARFAIFRKNPYIVTVHDLVRFYRRLDQETIMEKILLRLDIIGIKRASHIIAISQHTKNDLIKYMKIPEEKISVIYNGIDPSIFKPYDVRLRLLDKPYVLYVGSERPRKNLNRLFEAFAMLEKEFPDLKLLKVGPVGRYDKYRQNSERKLTNLGITRDVTFVDYVSEPDLACYYCSAMLLAYPSLYEGFGLPPVEAMACGCPVVASNTSSLPEVIGEAGIMVDPYDTDSLAQAMRRVLTDEKLRNDMIKKGLEQSKKFTWERAAEHTQEVYNKAANG
ncbi:glycosyltransferase family 4 protein [Chloroflexota bacterium]